MAENALAPEQKLPKAPPVLPDDEVLYELADLFRVFGDSTLSLIHISEPTRPY